MSISQFVGYSVEAGASGDLKPWNDPCPPPSQQKTRPASMCPQIDPAGLLCNETTVLASGERRKKACQKL